MSAGKVITRIDLPRRPRRMTFALTPLADALFQLLVFFMLSSNMSTYSLLGVRAGTVAAAGAEGAAPDPAPASGNALPAGDTAIWSVSRESIVAGGQRFGFDALPRLAAAMQDAGTARVLLVTRGDAQVQGLVSVLEALAAAGITDVQVAGGGRTATATGDGG